MRETTVFTYRVTLSPTEWNKASQARRAAGDLWTRLEECQRHPERSLGWVVPYVIDRFSYDHEKGEWPDKYQLSQMRFWGEALSPLEPIPYTFYVHFACSPECQGHRLSIIDWKIYQFYRRARTSEKVIQRLNTLNSKCNLSFFVGTSLKAHVFKTYMVIGLYYPPKTRNLVFPF
ncbi:hypothetical protein [Sulfobacillus thermosulfidooxidans]|uniref:hypothetical protein n=1 Tax=Sulfobacillus thermosulfidooxidans TaxID=28034 RepID=UPI0006B42D1C|nr:hypothetical protein [Sulfobacillus thermosulfidooxidans]